MTNEEFYEKEIEYVAKITDDNICAYVIIAKLIGKVDIDCDDFESCTNCYEAVKEWIQQEHKEEEKQEKEDRQESIIEHLLKTYPTGCIHGVYQNDNYIKLTIHNIDKEYFMNNNLNLLDTYQDPKIKLTKFEYDLLKCYAGNNTDHALNGIDCLKKLKNQGYFKNIDKSMKISEILKDCEIVTE